MRTACTTVGGSLWNIEQLNRFCMVSFAAYIGHGGTQRNIPIISTVPLYNVGCYYIRSSDQYILQPGSLNFEQLTIIPLCLHSPAAWVTVELGATKMYYLLLSFAVRVHGLLLFDITSTQLLSSSVGILPFPLSLTFPPLLPYLPLFHSISLFSLLSSLLSSSLSSPIFSPYLHASHLLLTLLPFSISSISILD